MARADSLANCPLDPKPALNPTVWHGCPDVRAGQPCSGYCTDASNLRVVFSGSRSPGARASPPASRFADVSSVYVRPPTDPAPSS